jgi:NAD(P)H-hydrate repair Nnr-like enzyme with NAD(P)H-hydrate dehydratase domain
VSEGHEGLGTGGSGDVLAGLVVGMMARGVPPVAALGWAVAAHATAGHLAATSLAAPGYGYLARELVDAIPAAITELQRAGGAAPA